MGSTTHWPWSRCRRPSPSPRLAWLGLDGKPAPRFAAETTLTIELSSREQGTLMRMTSDQRPVGPLQGAAMRVFGTRQVAKQMDRSLRALAERFAAE